MADPPVYELVDSSGNVVGEFKQVSGETVVDNQENDTVRIPSLSTEDATVTESFSGESLSQGTPSNPTQWIVHGTDDPDVSGYMSAETIITADNTDQDLIDVAAASTPLYSGLLVVSGKYQDGVGHFTDLVLIAGIAGITLTSSATRDNPGSRTYSRSGSIIEIAVDDNSNLYDVVVRYIGALNV